MLFALTIFIISVLASRDNVLEKVDLAEEYQGILGLLASPEISAATEALAKIKELVQTSSSSKVEIGERQRGELNFKSFRLFTA